MSAFATIPDAELEADLLASEQDIRVCHFALACGVTHHRDGFPVETRLNRNREIIATIRAEQERRRAELSELWTDIGGEG